MRHANAWDWLLRRLLQLRASLAPMHRFCPVNKFACNELDLVLAALLPSRAAAPEAEAACGCLRRAHARIRAAITLSIRTRPELHAVRGAQAEALRVARVSRHRARRRRTVERTRPRQFGDRRRPDGAQGQVPRHRARAGERDRRGVAPPRCRRLPWRAL